MLYSHFRSPLSDVRLHVGGVSAAQKVSRGRASSYERDGRRCAARAAFLGPSRDSEPGDASLGPSTCGSGGRPLWGL